jgi:hypothetical protein
VSRFDEEEAEIGGTLTQATKDARAVLGAVGGWLQDRVLQPVLERAVDGSRSLRAVHGDAFGLCRPDGQASIQEPS